MRFVEETEGTWTAIQLKAVEMEIEQQKKDWEANRLAALKQEEEERARQEAEENEMLTYSCEDPLNKVNNTKKSNNSNNSSTNSNSSNRKSLGSSRSLRSVVVGSSVKDRSRDRYNKSVSTTSNNLKNTRNNGGLTKRTNMQGKVGTSPKKSKRDDSKNEPEIVVTRRNIRRRFGSHKSSRSNSSSVNSRANTAKTASNNDENSDRVNKSDDSDSECSLDVMIDSNDVNDSDSNSIQNPKSSAKNVSQNNFDSSQDEETLMNEDSTLSATKIENKLLNNVSNSDSGLTSSPRTRSRGSVKINLWTLDESPIMPPTYKRQKTNHDRSHSPDSSTSNLSENHKKSESGDYTELKSDFGIREFKIVIENVDMESSKAGKSAENETGCSSGNKIDPVEDSKHLGKSSATASSPNEKRTLRSASPKLSKLTENVSDNNKEKRTEITPASIISKIPSGDNSKSINSQDLPDSSPATPLSTTATNNREGDDSSKSFSFPKLRSGISKPSTKLKPNSTPSPRGSKRKQVTNNGTLDSFVIKTPRTPTNLNETAPEISTNSSENSDSVLLRIRTRRATMLS